MVDVSHDDDDRTSRFEHFIRIRAVVNQTLLNGDDNFFFHLRAHFLRNDCGGIEVNDLILRRHDAQAHQLLDNVGNGCL